MASDRPTVPSLVATIEDAANPRNAHLALSRHANRVVPTAPLHPSIHPTALKVLSIDVEPFLGKASPSATFRSLASDDEEKFLIGKILIPDLHCLSQEKPSKSSAQQRTSIEILPRRRDHIADGSVHSLSRGKRIRSSRRTHPFSSLSF